MESQAGLHSIVLAEWLAARVKTEFVVEPGAHAAYCNLPDEFAEALRPVLKQAGASLLQPRQPASQRVGP